MDDQQRSAEDRGKLTVVCYKWFDQRRETRNSRYIYSAEHVNRLRRMVKRNLSLPHDFVCITDDPTGIDEDIRTLEINRELLALGRCYVRLYQFSREMERQIGGSRFLALDLDCVVVGDITDLIFRAGDFCIWAGAKETQYNASMILWAAGAREQIWSDFDAVQSPRLAAEADYGGSDQAWISYILGKGEQTWTAGRDGILSYKRHCRERHDLPVGARVVFFHGAIDPSLRNLQERHLWIGEHWR